MTSEQSTPRHLLRLELSDHSAKPGPELMERIAHHRRPLEEDLAIRNSWQFTARVITMDLSRYEPPVFVA